MSFRTDLAMEKLENISAPDGADISGIEKEQFSENGCEITDIKIVTEEAAKKLSKPRGRYITVEIPSPLLNPADEDSRAEVVSRQITKLLCEGSVLVAGLGNCEITPDALGPYAARRIFVTRHIPKDVAEETGLEGLRDTAAIAVGVLGQTGIESEETVRAAAEAVDAKNVIVIDALAAGSVKRIGTAIQITDTGITPGSGVQGGRREISSQSLGGRNVISVGVPTVVDAVTIAKESGGNGDLIDSLIVAPKDSDKLIGILSKIISKSVNMALFPELSPADLDYLVL